MQVVCVAEVTPDYDIRVDENIKQKLHPGEKIRIKIINIVIPKMRLFMIVKWHLFII